jgi:hypothetical protein
VPLAADLGRDPANNARSGTSDGFTRAPDGETAEGRARALSHCQFEVCAKCVKRPPTKSKKHLRGLQDPTLGDFCHFCRFCPIEKYFASFFLLISLSIYFSLKTVDRSDESQKNRGDAL